MSARKFWAAAVMLVPQASSYRVTVFALNLWRVRTLQQSAAAAQELECKLQMNTTILTLMWPQRACDNQPLMGIALVHDKLVDAPLLPCDFLVPELNSNLERRHQ